MCGTISATEAIDKISVFLQDAYDGKYDKETALMLIDEAIELVK